MPEGQGFVKQLRVGPQGRRRPALRDRSFLAGVAAQFHRRARGELRPSPGRRSQPASRRNAPPVVVKSADDAHGRDVIVAIDAGHGGVDPGLDRQSRHAREERDAGDRAAPEGAHRPRARHARRAHARQRSLRRASRAHRARAPAAGRHVRVRARRFVSRPFGRRLVGVRAVGARRERRIRALAGGPRERGGPDRRRLARRQGQRAGVGAARSVAGREHERERRRRAEGHGRAGPHRQRHAPRRQAAPASWC